MRRCSASPRSTTRSFPWSMRSVFSTRGKAPSGGWRCATRGTIAPTTLPSSGSASEISWKTTLHNLLDALILGIVEGLTEFLPISSTGHLILAGDLIGFDPPSRDVFYVAIQTGAMLAVLWEYRARFFRVDLQLWLHLVVAFIPAAVLGLAFGSFIKSHLFRPVPVALAFIVGGLIILLVDRGSRPARMQN